MAKNPSFTPTGTGVPDQGSKLSYSEQPNTSTVPSVKGRTENMTQPFDAKDKGIPDQGAMLSFVDGVPMTKVNKKSRLPNV